MLLLELLILSPKIEIWTFLKMIFNDSAMLWFFIENCCFKLVKLFWMFRKITQNKVEIMSVCISTIFWIINLGTEAFHLVGIVFLLIFSWRSCNCYCYWLKKPLFFFCTHLFEVKHFYETFDTYEQLFWIFKIALLYYQNKLTLFNFLKGSFQYIWNSDYFYIPSGIHKTTHIRHRVISFVGDIWQKRYWKNPIIGSSCFGIF